MIDQLRKRVLILIACLASSAGGFEGSALALMQDPQEQAGTVPSDFSHKIVPVLKKHCAECHTGKEAKGSFSMNNRELLVSSGHVVPGQPDESYLLELIQSSDLDHRMPPKDKPPLSAEEQELLKQWIRDGVNWDDGFSFGAPAYEPPCFPADRSCLQPLVAGQIRSTACWING